METLNNLGKSYIETLIALGAKSKKFKLLPKDAKELTVGEYLFLLNYLQNKS